MIQLLVVEDDKGLREGVELALQREDFVFRLCGSIAAAEKTLREMLSEGVTPDLMLLDINLPDGSGYELLKRFRAGLCRELPVIILSVNDMELDEVKGLELGADDYVTKPFSLMVLRARIDKVLKHAGRKRKENWQFGDLNICFEDRQVRKNGQEIQLSRTEWKLLQCLIENRNIVLDREFLIDRIWTDGASYVDENALSVTVNRLRSKLGEKADGHLQTVYGKGYVWKMV